MGVDTVGFTQTEDKDVFRVVGIIKVVLKTMGDSFPAIRMYPESQYITFNFSYGCVEERTLHLHFNCDSDYDDIHNGPKIIWSVAKWGHSEEIIRAICQAMTEVGPTWFCLDDCKKDWEELEILTP